MRKLIWPVLVLLSGNILAGTECEYDFSVQSAAVEVTDTAQVISRDTTVNRGQGSSNGNCQNFHIFFGKGLANSYQRKAFSLGGSALNYNLHQNTNLGGILKEFGDATNNNEFISGLAPNKNQDYTSTFYVSVPGISAQNSPAAGYYFDIVQVRVYGFNPGSGNYNFDETRNLFITLYIEKKIDISLVDEGGAFDSAATSKVMDFGFITQNQEKGADLKIVSNTSYQVKLSSLNNGSLKHSNNSAIDYALRVNGTTVALGTSAASPVTIGSGTQTNNAGSTFNLKVRILSDTENMTPGEYTDVITITAIAN